MPILLYVTIWLNIKHIQKDYRHKRKQLSAKINVKIASADTIVKFTNDV